MASYPDRDGVTRPAKFSTTSDKREALSPIIEFLRFLRKAFEVGVLGQLSYCQIPGNCGCRQIALAFLKYNCKKMMNGMDCTALQRGVNLFELS